MTTYVREIVFTLLAVLPTIWIQNQLVGAYEGQEVSLECHSEAFPKSINYWTRDTGEILPQSKHPFTFCIIRPIKFNGRSCFLRRSLLRAKGESSTCMYELFSGGKYETSASSNGYKTQMRLTINSVTAQDYGNYRCVSKNSLGDSEGTIQLFGKFSN